MRINYKKREFKNRRCRTKRNFVNLIEWKTKDLLISKLTERKLTYHNFNKTMEQVPRATSRLRNNKYAIIAQYKVHSNKLWNRNR